MFHLKFIPVRWLGANREVRETGCPFSPDGFEVSYPGRAAGKDGTLRQLVALRVCSSASPGSAQAILVCGGGEAGAGERRVGLIPYEVGAFRKVEIPSAHHRAGGGDIYI